MRGGVAVRAKLLIARPSVRFLSETTVVLQAAPLGGVPYRSRTPRPPAILNASGQAGSARLALGAVGVEKQFFGRNYQAGGLDDALVKRGIEPDPFLRPLAAGIAAHQLVPFDTPS
jgi:hypothetical protein